MIFFRTVFCSSFCAALFLIWLHPAPAQSQQSPDSSALASMYRYSVLKLPFQTSGDTSAVGIGASLLMPSVINSLLLLHPKVEETWIEEYQTTLFPTERAVREWVAGKTKYPQGMIDEEFHDRYVLQGTLKLGKRITADISITDRQTNKKTIKSLEIDLPTLAGFQSGVLALLKEAGIAISDSDKTRMVWQDDLSRAAFDDVCRRYYYTFRFDYQTAVGAEALRAGLTATKSAPKSYIAAVDYSVNMQMIDYVWFADSIKRQFIYALTLNPNGFAAANGLYYIALDNRDDAAIQKWGLRKAVIQGRDGKSTIAEAYVAQAQMAANKKEYAKAAVFYLKAIEFQPRSMYLVRLARMYTLTDNTALADPMLRKAIQTTTNEADKQLLRQGLAEMWHEHGTKLREIFDRNFQQSLLDSAMTSYQTALNEFYKVRFATDLCAAYLRTGRLGDSAKIAAIETLTSEANRRFPESDDRQRFTDDLSLAFDEYALVLASRRDTSLNARTEAYFKHAISLDPDNFSYVYNLIQFYIKNTNKTDAAEQAITNAFKRVQNDAGKSSALWYCRGVIASRKQQFPTAIDNFQKSKNLNPSNYGTIEALALAYAQAKRYADAIPLLEKCIARDDSHFQTFTALGVAYFQVKNYDKSKLALQKSFALNARSNEATYQLARIHTVKKEYSEAIKYLEIALQGKVATIDGIDEDATFLPLKSRPEYEQLKAKYRR